MAPTAVEACSFGLECKRKWAELILQGELERFSTELAAAANRAKLGGGGRQYQ